MDDFERTEFSENPESQWPKEWQWGDRTLTAIKTEPEFTWVDFSRWFRRNAGGNVGTQPVRDSAYAETVITSPSDRKVVLRLGFDDWMKMWLNDKVITTLKHEDGFRLSEVPVTFNKGENRLRIKLSNFDNVEWSCWTFSCIIANATADK